MVMVVSCCVLSKLRAICTFYQYESLYKHCWLKLSQFTFKTHYNIYKLILLVFNIEDFSSYLVSSANIILSITFFYFAFLLLQPMELVLALAEKLVRLCILKDFWVFLQLFGSNFDFINLFKSFKLT